MRSDDSRVVQNVRAKIVTKRRETISEASFRLRRGEPYGRLSSLWSHRMAAVACLALGRLKGPRKGAYSGTAQRLMGSATA